MDYSSPSLYLYLIIQAWMAYLLGKPFAEEILFHKGKINFNPDVRIDLYKPTYKSKSINLILLNKYNNIQKSKSFNCWGATLMYFGSLNTPLWVGDYQMEAWLKNHSEPVLHPEINDILIFRNEEDGELLHTAVYLGNNEVWHKQGWNQSSIATINEVHQCYAGRISFAKIKF